LFCFPLTGKKVGSDCFPDAPAVASQPTELNSAIQALIPEAAPTSSLANLADKISAVESIKADAAKIVEKALIVAVADCNTNALPSVDASLTTVEVK
jgi:hypothetical protein